MTVQAFIMLTPDQESAAATLIVPGYAVRGQIINNTLANNLGFGTLVGQYVVPARILNDTGYAAWVPTLGTYPIHILDTDTLFVIPKLP